MQNVLCRLRCDTSAPNSPGRGETDHRVEVRPVQVHLAPRLVHEVADGRDRVLEHTVRRRVGDHQRTEPRPVGLDLGAKVVEVDVAVVVAGHDDDVEAGHDRARRVRAVRRRRDEAHDAVVVTAAAVVRADGQQPGVLTLRTRIRLQRHRVITRDLAEPLLEVAEEGEVAARLIEGSERMDRRPLGPADRCHLRRRVQLHRAGAERDHRSVEGDVAIARGIGDTGASTSRSDARGTPGAS